MQNSQKAKVQIIDLNYNSPELEPFYELYRSIFQVSEKDYPENIKKHLLYKTTGFYSQNNYHVIIAKKTGIVGFLVGYYYNSSSFGFIESIGVDKGVRGKGISGLLLKEFEMLANRDSRNSVNGLNGIMVEVEDPQKTGSDNNCLTFWDHYSYKLVCINYIKPSFMDGKLPEQNLLLLIKNLDGGSYIEAEILISFLIDHFKYVLNNDNPEKIEEFIKIRSEVSSHPYVTLRKVGPALFKGVSIHYLITLDIGTYVTNLSEFKDGLLGALGSDRPEWNIIKYGSLIEKNQTINNRANPLIFARYLQNDLNFSTSYLTRRSIVRFTRRSWENRDASVEFESVPGRKYSAYMSTLSSYNSMGVLGLEIILRFNGSIFPELMMEMVERSELKIDARSIEYIAEKKLRDIFNLLNDEKVVLKDYNTSIQIYPLIISTSYSGNLDTKTLYGILNGDPSYDSVSKQEIERKVGSSMEREDISIVDSILAYYELDSTFVASRSEEIIFNTIEEITGYTVSELGTKWHDAGTIYKINEIVFYSMEAEYVTEIELLRNQFTILMEIVERYTDKGLSNNLRKEQKRLIADEDRIERKMVEINLIDVERYTPLKSVLQNNQHQMGISELKDRATQLRSQLYRETSTFFDLDQAHKSNILNFLVAILIISSSLIAFMDSLHHPYLSNNIEIVTIISALVLIVLYLKPIKTDQGGKTGGK